MPSKSKSQARLMAAVAHNPEFAKKVGIPVSVGKEFNKADKGKKFKEGGEMKESKEMVKKEIGFMKKAGAPKSMIKHEMSEAKGMKSGGMAECKTIAKKEVQGHEKRMHGMATGGRIASKGEHSVQTKSKRGAEIVKMARGGGIEIKGKTKGKFIKMCGGGMAKGKK